MYGYLTVLYNFESIQTIILSVVLYGCETWQVALREGYKLIGYESKVQSKIYLVGRKEVTRGWKKTRTS
jgi:hypothetical protein